MRCALIAVAVAWGCAHGGASNGTDANRGRDGNSGADDSSIGSIDAAIDGNGCATQPCDLATQCGCATSQACDLDPQNPNTTTCRAVTMQGMETSTCPADTDCAQGYVCVGDGTNDACEKYCQSNSECASPRGQCAIQLVDNTGTPIAGAVTCSSNCDPALVANPSTCPTGWSCDVFTAPFMGSDVDIADCRKAGTAGQGAACSATVACAAGYSCVNTGTTVCARICKPPSNTGCAGATTCTSFATPFVIGGVEYGVCI
jgi:hypothetical protein